MTSLNKTGVLTNMACRFAINTFFIQWSFFLAIMFSPMILIADLRADEPEKESVNTNSNIDVMNMDAINKIKLSSITGEESFLELTGEETLVIEWFNQECPFVKKIYRNNFINDLKKSYQAKGVRWVIINSTSPEHADFVAVKNRSKLASELQADNSSLYFDESGALGKALGAKTTPHMFVISKGNIVYQGAFDNAADTDSDPREAINYVKLALEAVLMGKSPETAKTRPYGCSIKYHK
ncbi:MAG TPA: redoxin family protein [Oligoflexia bacterium]|nr:redoxin family protein [Oligoflexia bacterium]HMP49348.1 redoxin family protein [Oligoflexia bacterium]